MKNKKLNNKELREEAFAVLHHLSAKNQPLETLSTLITQMTIVAGLVDKFAKERAECIDAISQEEFLEVMMPMIADTPNKEQMLPAMFEQLKTELKKPDISFFNVQSQIIESLVGFHKNVMELQKGD